jgi:hypothetical protein
MYTATQTQIISCRAKHFYYPKDRNHSTLMVHHGPGFIPLRGLNLGCPFWIRPPREKGVSGGGTTGCTVTRAAAFTSDIGLRPLQHATACRRWSGRERTVAQSWEGTHRCLGGCEEVAQRRGLEAVALSSLVQRMKHRGGRKGVGDGYSGGRGPFV